LVVLAERGWQIGLRHAAKGVIGERRLVAVRVGESDMQLLMKERRSKTPPVTRRDRWGTQKFKIKGRATRPERQIEAEIAIEKAWKLN
jgi:hypothetical protein